MVNAVLLILAAAYILFEAYRRFQSPPDIASTGMLIVAAVGLAVNLISMRVLQAGAESSLNMKGAYLEVWSDALGSVGVIGAALLIRYTGFWQADPIVAVLIGLWVLPRTWTLLSESINVLLEGVPQGLALQEINDELLRIPGVREVHDLHVWSITTGKNTLTAHLVCDAGAGEPEQAVLQEAQAVLGKRFGVTHSTIQIEATRCAPGGEDCSFASPPHVEEHTH